MKSSSHTVTISLRKETSNNVSAGQVISRLARSAASQSVQHSPPPVHVAVNCNRRLNDMALFLVVDIEQKSQQRGTFGQNRNRIRTTWYLRTFRLHGYSKPAWKSIPTHPHANHMLEYSCRWSSRHRDSNLSGKYSEF